MAEGQYKFSISLDNSQLKRDINGAKKQFEKLGGDVKKVGKDIDASLKEAMEGFTPPPGMAAKTEEAKRSFDGLNMATQNIVRELPAASIGLNTFFLAISNNIPIYADQVKLLAQRNRELAASGKPTVSVIKQMGAAFFSWQTAMMAGITALTMFGAKLFGLSKEEKNVTTAVDEETRKREQLNKMLEEEAEIMSKHEKAMRDEFVMVNKLVEQYANATTSEEQRYRILQQLRDISPDIVTGINDEADAMATLRDNVKAYNDEQLVRMSLRHLQSSNEKLAEDYAKAVMNEYTAREKLLTAREELIKRGAKDAEPIVVFWSDDINKQKSDKQFNLEDKDIVKSRLDRALGTDNLREIWDLIGTMDVGWSNLPIIGARERKVNTANIGYGVSGGWEIREIAENYATAYDDLLTTQRKFNDGMRINAQARERILADARKTLGEDFMIQDADEDSTYADRIEDFKKKLRADATKADLESMEDGLAKKLSQINYDYDREEETIKKREEELATLRGGYLTDNDKALIGSLRKANETKRDNAVEAIMQEEIDSWVEAEEERKEAMDKAAADWDDYLIEYGSFRERYKALQSKYEREIAEAETDGARKALEAERDIVLATMDVQMSSFAQDIVGKTTTELNAMVDELMAQMEAAQAALNAKDSTTGDDAAQYRKTIATLEAQIEALKEQLSKAKQEVKDDNWADATQTFQNISRAASDAASGIEEFDEGLANTFQNIAQLSGAAINMIGSIQGVMKAFAGGMSTIEKASAILAIIGAAIQAFSLLMTLFKGSDEVEQTMHQFEELNAELERFRKLAQIDSIEGTIFGKDAFGNFINNLRVMREALDELNESKNKIRDYRLDYWAETVWGGAYASGDKYDSYEEALANMYVKTRDRSDFAEFLGATDEYAKLADLYPELFAGGEVSLEGLRKLRDSDVWEKLSQQNRDLIDELIADWERYEDATTAVTDYLTDVFGELGNEINDAIVDAWKNGTDAAVAFGDVAGKVLENLISQIGYTAYIAPILSQAMADVENLNKQNMTPEEYLNALMGIVGSAMTKAEAGLEDYNEYLDRADRMAEEQGINAFNGERTAATKGIAQASQDSVDELNGRATAIQSHTFSIMESTKQLTRDTAAMLSHLAGIESNTAELRQMRLDMSAMRRDINDMATRGIVTR